MKKEVHDLVEAVRGLGIKLTGDPAPRCVRISGDARDFAERLERVQRALEALDAAEAASSDAEAPGMANDPGALRKALDGLLRLIQVKGMALEEADAIVRDALGLQEAETKKKGTLPAFKPSKLKRKRGYYSVRLKMFPERPGEVKIDDLKKIVHELGATESILGSTMARNEASFERSVRKLSVPPVPGMKR